MLKSILTIRFHLTDGSVHSFVQPDAATAQKLWEGIDPAKLFARPRIIIGSEHSKAVFVSQEIIRIDFLQDGFQCWEFPGGYSDIVELSEDVHWETVGTGRPWGQIETFNISQSWGSILKSDRPLTPIRLILVREGH